MSTVPKIKASPPWRPRPRFAERLAQPGVIAALWALTTLVHVVDQLRFPDFSEGSQYVSSILFLASVPILAALAAAAVSKSRDAALALAGRLMLMWFAASLAWLAIEFAFEPLSFDIEWIGLVIALLATVATPLIVARGTRQQGISKRRRWAAALVALAVLVAWPAIAMFDDQLISVSAQYATAEEPSDPPPQIDEERVWGAQPRLVESALAGVAPSAPGTPTTFVVAVGAGGSQQLFGREARFARTVLGRAFQAERRNVLLANDQESIERVPLATNTNLGAVLAALGKRADPQRDLVVIYLTAHGNREAELTTNLPDYADLSAIGAKSLAAALAKAGIRRRVIIVSACYAGSWIKPLASDDTIVVAAARADRSSFGCSDERQLTYFGEAFLEGPLLTRASLAESFLTARRSVRRWEEQESLQPSEPQAFVGKNMAAVWNAKRSSRR